MGLVRCDLMGEHLPGKCKVLWKEGRGEGRRTEMCPARIKNTRMSGVLREQTPLSVKFTVCVLFFLVLLVLNTTQGKTTPVALSDAVLACLVSELWYTVEAWGGRAGQTEDRALHSPALMIAFWSEYVRTEICRGCVWPEMARGW